MTEWTHEIIDRLYALYEQHFDRLQRDAVVANRLLGSASPKKTHLKRLTRAQFEALLTAPTNDREVIELWIRRISRGHEDALAGHQAAV
jgi:hypothetical protein